MSRERMEITDGFLFFAEVPLERKLRESDVLNSVKFDKEKREQEQESECLW